MAIDPRLLQIGIEELPAAIDLLRGLFAKRNPTAPPLLDSDVVAIFIAAYTSSLAKDDLWLATHPQFGPIT